MARQVKWTNQCSVYVPELDAEHRTMFALTSELQRLAGESAAPREFRKPVGELLRHTAGHFVREERLMRSVKYPLLAWHKRQHDHAKSRVDELARRIQAGDCEAGAELVNFLAGWMKDHISVSDRMMSAYYRSRMRLHHALAS